jgi:branched-chain amino acid transport system substrate-binding protein
MTPYPIANLRLRLLVCSLGLLAPLFTGIGAHDRPIVIGTVYNLHGFQANLDVPSVQGARLAIREVNEGRGLLARSVELAVADGVSKPKVIARKTGALLKRFPEMPALIGLSDTDMVLAAAPVAASAERVFLTSGATSPKLPEQVPEYLFLACFGDNVQAAAAAESAWLDLQARSAAVLYAADNTYTDLLQGYFSARFVELGGEIDLVRSYETGRLDGVADGLFDVDLVFLATSSAEEALSLIELIRASGVAVPIFGGDSYDSEESWRQATDVRDVYFTTHAYLGADSPDPLVQRFRRAYAEAYDGTEPDAFAALGYDTARLLMTAIQAAGRTDPESVREGLSSIREFTGVTGTMLYPAGSRIPVKSVTILRIEQGNTTLFKQLLPESVPDP